MKIRKLIIAATVFMPILSGNVLAKDLNNRDLNHHARAHLTFYKNSFLVKVNYRGYFSPQLFLKNGSYNSRHVCVPATGHQLLISTSDRFKGNTLHVKTHEWISKRAMQLADPTTNDNACIVAVVYRHDDANHNKVLCRVSVPARKFFNKDTAKQFNYIAKMQPNGACRFEAMHTPSK